MPDGLLNIPQRADRIFVILFILLVVFWFGMMVSAYLVWNIYDSSSTVSCNEVKICNDPCANLRVGSLVHGICCTITICLLCAWLSFIYLDFHRLMVYATIVFLVGFFMLFGTSAFGFFSGITYFTRTLAVPPCRDIAPHDTVVGAMIGMIGLFALTAIIIRFYLTLDINDNTQPPLLNNT